MKKLFTLLLAVVMIACLGVSAFAASYYTITLDAGTNGGTTNGVSTRDVATDSNKRLSGTYLAEKDGHSFDGWFTAPTGGEKVDSTYQFKRNTTIYAQFTEIKKETVVVYAVDAKTDKKIEEIGTIFSGSEYKGNKLLAYLNANIDSADLERDGYKRTDGFFNGDWLPGKIDENVTVNGYTNVAVKYTKVEKVRVFAVSADATNLDDATLLEEGIYDKGSMLADALTDLDPELEKTGYTYDKWYKGDSLTWKFADDAVIEGWTNVAVKYTPNSYTVVFDANDGEGTMEAQEFTYDEAQELTANAFTNAAACDFDGWNTEADGTGDAYADGEEVSNLTAEEDGTVTLYAQWKQHSIVPAAEKLEPTCTKAGHLAYYYCEGCEDFFCLTADLQKDEVQDEVQLDEAEENEYTRIGNEDALAAWLGYGDGYLAPLGHDMGEWEDSKDGKTHTRACLREGCEYTETEEHVYKKGVCEICEAKEPKPAPKAPKTGDESNVALWAVMALTLGGGATAVVLKKKHN